VVYKDLASENVYYLAEERVFKLLPPELIGKSCFKMIHDASRFGVVSPEMLVTLQ
jgi:hypothetical protein